MSYSAPLYVRLRVVGTETVEEDVYLCDMPVMQGAGVCVINGADRAVVAQIQRSPGVDFDQSVTTDGQKSQSCRFIPERGTWIEFSTGRKDVLQVRLGQSGRMPATWLLRALMPDLATDAQILGYFHGVEEAPLTGPGAGDAVVGRRLADDIVNSDTGEVVAAAGESIVPALATTLVAAGMTDVAVLKRVDDDLLVRTVQADPVKDHASALLRLYARFRPGEPASVERATTFVAERFTNPAYYSLGKVGRFRINRKFRQDVPLDQMTLCTDDLLNAMRFMLRMRREAGLNDDIDDLGNRVLRTIDRLLEGPVRNAVMRWRQHLAEQLTSAEGTVPSPRTLAATRLVARAVEEFFCRGELSQVVDQVNPLAELNHVRRISALARAD